MGVNIKTIDIKRHRASRIAKAGARTSETKVERGVTKVTRGV